MRGSRNVFLALSVSVLLFAPACGGGSGSTSPTPTATAPTITTPNTMVYIGQAVTFQATGTGTITWGGDQSSVATVDGPTGRVTGVATGDETIWAQNSAGRTTRLIHVLPSFAGTWSGNYAITGCQSLGQFTTLLGFCNAFPAGAVLNMGFSINQSQDQVSGGTFSLGGLQGTLNPASVSGAGELPITGLVNSVNGSATITSIALGNARLDSNQAGVMTGTFDQTWGQANGLSGSGILSCQIRLMTRTGGGPSAITIFQRPEPASLTLEQMIERMR